MKKTIKLKTKRITKQDIINEKNQYIKHLLETNQSLLQKIEDIKDVLGINSRTYGYNEKEPTIIEKIVELRTNKGYNEGAERPEKQTILILERMLRVALKDETLKMEAQYFINSDTRPPLMQRSKFCN